MGELARRASQVERIFAHLMSGKSITPKQAEDLVGSMRLGARISDIKHRYNIYVKTTLSWDSEKKRRWAVYSIPVEERMRWRIQHKLNH